MKEKKHNIVLSLSGLTLVMVGALLFIYPFWTDIYSRYELERLGELPVVVMQGIASDVQVPARDNLEEGFKGTRLDIPAINVSTRIIEGTSSKDLRKAPGWYQESALHGEGNTAIAGHRSMYNGQFRYLDRLKVGDIVILRYRGQAYTYKVEKVFTVSSDDWSIITPCGYQALTLTTCHPEGQRKRLAVRAVLLDIKEIKDY